MNIVLYLQAHQPYRVRDYTIFDAGKYHDYFSSHERNQTNNKDALDGVCARSYLPTNQVLIHMLNTYPDFKVSLSLSGALLEQLEEFRPDVLESFQQLVTAGAGRVEILGETYHHSLSFFYDLEEFEEQVRLHSEICDRLLNYKPHSFRNTELAYNNRLGQWADNKGYEAVLTEGWDPILAWRSPNHVYEPLGSSGMKLLARNHRLSDDISVRFGDKSWAEWPMDAGKFTDWLRHGDQDSEVINLFMSYETFGERQWEDTGIFDFLKALPEQWMDQPDRGFMTVSEAARSYDARGSLDMPDTVTWANCSHDLSTWSGNSMQQEAIRLVYGLRDSVLRGNDASLIRDWRMLQTSDHFSYMSTESITNGGRYTPASPYLSPYEAQMSYMNVYLDMKARLARMGALDV